MPASESVIEYLVVDDDDDFRNRLVKALEDRQHRAAGSSTISQASKFLEQKTVKRIVLDLRIGAESGLTLLEQLPQTEETPQVVVLTGYGSIVTATKSIKLGAINFVSKPLSVDEIIGAFEIEQSDLAQTETDIEIPSLPEVEWEHIQRVLYDCNGNISKTAKLLGLHRRSLQRKLQRTPRKEGNKG